MSDLNRESRVVLLKLKECGEGTVEQLAQLAQMDQAAVMRGILALKEAGLVRVSEETKYHLSLSEEGLKYLQQGLPEKCLLRVLEKEMPLDEAKRKARLSDQEMRIALGWLRRKKLVKIENNLLRPTEEGLRLRDETWPEEAWLRRASKGQVIERVDPELQVLCRRGLVHLEKRVSRHVSLTELGKKTEVPPPEEEVSELTTELLVSGKWREVKFKRYNVLAPVSPVYPARLHPQQRVIDEVREVLISLGFQEIPSRIVETEFWNFDALFQAQDHPAREIHDSLTLKKPSLGEIPEELARKVAVAHERGVGGSRGWGYRFDFNISRRLLLCSQTTAATVRYLSGRPAPPVKIFSIGRVFRHDKIDYKHLAEFYQCEGIVMQEGLTLRDMFGYLKEILRKLGFERVRFRPSYFPYTEPSAEALVYHEARGEWVEVLGAGMFRPELLLPLGIRQPVLAWGIGLSRLIMLRLGVDDIRMLFSNDLNWLRSG